MSGNAFDDCAEKLAKRLAHERYNLAQVETVKRDIIIPILRPLFDELTERNKVLEHELNERVILLKATITEQAQEIERLRGELKHCEWGQGFTDVACRPIRRPVVESLLHGDEEDIRITRLVKEGKLSPTIPGTTVTHIIGACPRCHNLKSWGHTSDCKLAAALGSMVDADGQ